MSIPLAGNLRWIIACRSASAERTYAKIFGPKKGASERNVATYESLPEEAQERFVPSEAEQMEVVKPGRGSRPYRVKSTSGLQASHADAIRSIASACRSSGQRS